MKKRHEHTRTLTIAAITALVLPSGNAKAEAGSGATGGGIPEIASKFVIRLQERVQKADEAALRGAQLMADGDYEGAITEFKAAIDLLPDAPITKDRRDAYVKQYANASVKLAQQRADEAEYAKARELLQAVLAPDIDPDNFEAKKLLERLNDPDWYSPALTPEHLANVRIVEKALKTAQGYIDIGDYDKAEQEYFKVLNVDKTNSAARRGLESVDRERMDYQEVARNSTRAEFLRRVAEGWELPVPVSITGAGLPSEFKTDTSTDRIAEIENKLKTIIIPSVEFVQTPLRDAIAFLRSKAQDLDKTADVTKRGVDIIIQAGNAGGAAPVAPPAGAPAPGGAAGGFDAGAGAAPAAAGFGGGGVEDTPITLQLNNVPLVEALRYTLALANLKYKVEPNAVVVLPLSQPDADLFTNVYVVPPTFLSTGGGAPAAGGGAAPVDPFAAAPAAGGGGAGPALKKTAKEVLESYGVVFREGASATFNPQTSQLIVRQTQDQMELVEAVIDSIRDTGQKQIFITSKFVEVSEEIGKELGFDWLLGPFNIGSPPKVFGAGGTPGNTGNIDPSSYTFVQPGASVPVGVNPLTAGLRSGANALTSDTIDGLINAGISSGATGVNPVAPAIFGIAGVFTDPQFQVMIRALNQHKGVDLLSAPSVLARSGQRAKIEVIREFIYPTEYDPPEILVQAGNGNNGGAGGGNGGASVAMVTPANPAAFETRNTGVTLEVDPVIGGDSFTIDLNLSPEVVDFEGFINYGSPINMGNPAFNQLVPPPPGTPATIEITPNRIEMPVFATRKVTTQVTIWDGQTVALGGLIREDVQDVQDKVPFIGDLPVIGRLFRNDVELRQKKNLTIFVTATLVDPAGARFKQGGDTLTPQP
jgi:general secretion pathway protein D